MAKAGGKDFLIEKGEKLGLGIAAGLGLLLLALGIMGLGNRPQDPDRYQRELKTKADALTATMNQPTADILPVSADLARPATAEPVKFAANVAAYFDATTPPDGRRTAPLVLSLTEGQADMVTLKIPATDIQFLERNESGEVTKFKVGVVATKEKDKAEPGKFLADISKRFGKGMLRYRQNPGAGTAGGAGMLGGPPGGAGALGGPPPGAGGGGMFGAGGGMIGGPPPGGGGMLGGPPPGAGGGMIGGPPPGGGGFGGRGGGPPPGGPSFPGAPGGLGGVQDERLEVKYLFGSSDEEIDKEMAKVPGARLAITIQPQRMVVLQASFPYAAQLLNYARALRYKDVKELYAVPDDMPTFLGVDVQRRTYQMKGREREMIQDWTPVDPTTNSQFLRAVAIGYKEDSLDLKRVMLHEDHLLVMPLPHEIAGKYPETNPPNLPTIKQAISKSKLQDPKALAGPPPKSRYTGEGNPFKRGNENSAGMYGPGMGGTGSADGPSGPGMGNLFPPGLTGPPRGGKGGGETGPAVGGSTGYAPPDFVYVRAYDTDIRDGHVYEYRARAKLKNPNYGKKDYVSKASDAELEEMPPLEEHWYSFPQFVSVPQNGYQYVIDPPAKADPKVKELSPVPAPKEGQAVIQFHRWYDELYLDEKHKEPIGDWVLSNLLVTRGQYVGGKAFSPVPLWSSENNVFQLRTIPGDPKPAPPKGKEPAKEPRRGVVVEPARPKELLVVDVAGGKSRLKLPQSNPGDTRGVRSQETTDESATEILFMKADGTLELRNSSADKLDPSRKDREEAFRKWRDEGEKNTGLGGPAPGKGNNDF